MSGYGNIDDVKEGSANTALSPGIHPVHIESLIPSEISTEKYTGWIADLVLTDGDLSLKERIFPFNFNPSFKTRDGVLISEADQWASYKAKHLHLFSKACDRATLESVVNGATSFQDYIARYASKATRENGGTDFKILVVDKKGFSTYPMWTGGSACLIDENTLKFDPVKHGPKPKDDSAVESPAPSGEGKDKVPF